MKKIILPFAAGALLCFAVLALTAFRSGGDSPNYVTMNVVEGLLGSNQIVIHYENGSTESVELEAVGKKSVMNNLQKTHDTMNMLAVKGYRLVQTVNKGSITSFIFEKR